MAKLGLENALSNVEMTYEQVSQIGNEILDPILEPINKLFGEISNNVNDLGVNQLRDFIVRLQLRAFELSEIKEKSSMKATVANMLKEEVFAREFNAAEGPVTVKNNIALIKSSEEAVVEALYELVAGMLKTKLDQILRMIDSLKSVLVSRMQEAKLTSNALE